MFYSHLVSNLLKQYKYKKTNINCVVILKLLITNLRILHIRYNQLI